MHNKCDHFGIHELIPPPAELPDRLRETYNLYADLLFRLFPWQYLVTLDRIRGLFGPATVNNWWWYDDHAAAPYKFSGFRPMGCATGSNLSEHRFCRAADMKFKHVTPAEVWAYIQRNPKHPAFEFVERVEAYEGMSWFHWDMGQHARNGAAIRVFTVTDNRAGLPEYIERAAA